MTEIVKEPLTIFEEIKSQLTEAVNDRNHSFHTPVFSNILNIHETESRTVVMRKFDSQELIIHFHTDIRSKKIKSLVDNPNTNLLFYDSEIKTQLRIKLSSNVNHKNEIASESWNNTKIYSRKCYLTKKSPSSISLIPSDGLPNHLAGVDPSKEESEKGFENFAVITNKIQSIDWLKLSSQGHKRLLIIIEKMQPEFKWLIP